MILFLGQGLQVLVDITVDDVGILVWRSLILLLYVHLVVVRLLNFGDSRHHVFHVELLLGNLHFGNLIYVAGLVVVFVGRIEHEFTLEEFQGAGSFGPISVDAPYDETPNLFIFYPIQTLRVVSVDHLPVDLGRVGTLPIRGLSSDHLKDSHSEGVDVDFFAVVFFVQLWCHKLGSPQN